MKNFFRAMILLTPLFTMNFQSVYIIYYGYHSKLANRLFFVTGLLQTSFHWGKAWYFVVQQLDAL